MLKYSSLSFLRAAVFSHRLYVDNALNHRALAQQLSMKLTISLLLKNTIDFFFFLEHKLYGFPQSVVNKP